MSSIKRWRLLEGIYYGMEWRHTGLMDSTLDSVLSGLSSNNDQGHSVAFLGKTLYSRSASLILLKCVDRYQQI